MNTKTQGHEKCLNTKRKIRATVNHIKTKENKIHILYIFLETLYFEETFYWIFVNNFASTSIYSPMLKVT